MHFNKTKLVFELKPDYQLLISYSPVKFVFSNYINFRKVVLIGLEQASWKYRSLGLNSCHILLWEFKVVTI